MAVCNPTMQPGMGADVSRLLPDGVSAKTALTEDLGADPAHAGEIARLKEMLLDWATSHHNRITRSDADIESYAGSEFHIGILIGFWDEEDLAEASAAGHGGN